MAEREGEEEGGPADYSHYHDRAGFQPPEYAAASLSELVRGALGYRRSGCWLDIGFGEGALLHAAQSHGWNCHGMEVSPHALAFGRMRGWSVATPSAAAEAFHGVEFDVVSMVEVIEHLADPLGSLRSAAARLRRGGLLILTTPNAASLNCRLLGARWSVFCPPEHLTIWSRRGLHAALGASGLCHVRIKTHGLNPAELWPAGQKPGRSVDRQQTAAAWNRALSQTALRRTVKHCANGILSLLGVGDTLKAWSEKPK